MCDHCGCSPSDNSVTIHKPSGHGHNHDHQHRRTVRVEQDILFSNNQVARITREYFQSQNITALNLVSSPGSGKTTLLEQTIRALNDEIRIAVIEGDQQTMRDAQRIEATGVPVVQVNTGTGCHLDARMIEWAIHQLPLKDHSLLFIENVGNLVCPALFDLGEDMKVVIISVTEGDDKPQKYPTMFEAASLGVITKTDLLPYVDFDMEECRRLALAVNPALEFHAVSAKTGQGMDTWLNWLRNRCG